jgi:small subunit ribosomal protein S17
MPKKLINKNQSLSGKIFTGKVVSDKMTDTIVVTVSSKYRHPLYKKIVNKIHKFYAKNNLKAKIGDTVSIKEVRPISKLKRFITVNIEKKA